MYCPYQASDTQDEGPLGLVANVINTIVVLCHKLDTTYITLNIAN
jgi:hypothetical protein